jgi:hypothetical protein
MAIILQYRRPAEPAPRLADASDSVLGQVIIFPGVRIDRYAAEQTPGRTVTSSRKGTQRGRKKQRR